MKEMITDKAVGTFGLFNESFPPIMDGVAVAVRNYAYWLYEAGYDTCVVTPRAPDSNDTDPYPVYRYPSIPITMRKPYRLGLPELDPALKSLCQRTRFALVHAHSPFSAGLLAMRVAREQGVPFVATFHSKYRDDFERATRSRRLAELMLKEVIWFYEKADEVWVPQRAVADTLREYGFRGAVEVVDNGNDMASDEPLAPLRQEARRALGRPDGECVLLFVGQHIWEKNPRLVVEALARLKGQPFHMYFVGTGYAADDLRRLVADCGLDGQVTFAGAVTDREVMRRYYAAADLFLFPSLYDNAPLVVREAAALGVPSVMVAGSTAAEILADGVAGFLVQNTPESLSGEILRLMQHPDLVRQAGDEARRTLARSWRSIVQGEVLDRYLSLIRRKG